MKRDIQIIFFALVAYILVSTKVYASMLSSPRVAQLETTDDTQTLQSNNAIDTEEDVVAHFDMSLSDGKITDDITSNSYTVESVSTLPAINVNGLEGKALRFDGYSNFVKASIPSDISSDSMTLNVLLATETYPMMQTDNAEETPTYATICGNLDSLNKGFALELSSQGDLQFRFGTANGFIFKMQGSQKLDRGRWNMLTVVLDKSKGKGWLYLNGTPIDSCRNRYGLTPSTSAFYIGKDSTEVKSDNFLLNTFCGLIDDITIYNKAMDASQVQALLPDSLTLATPDFNYPESRYANSLWRPKFHGMPSGGWTNETHGMTYSNGKYHGFFQKIANGPYMSRLHWGHISSENLYKWHEEPIAIYPGESYDIKGCWSGCVFSNDNLTAGKPNILYTAVDNSRAVIAQAMPADDDLKVWTKSSSNPIINGRPSGLSSDFRDAYFFTANNQQYIIVGTSKDGIGACTLHRYENGTWTNDGSIFFQGNNVNEHGSFWEMPNITNMGNKWLFTATPLGLGTGVHTLYWTGAIASDGTFVADSTIPQSLEMGGVSHDGYGLLSPTIFQKDGKTILMGIVPDKLPSSANYVMGWAHNYSLPREISLDADGNLIQKPFDGLVAMRTENKWESSSSIDGTVSIDQVSGRQVELLGDFTIGSSNFGFRFLKNGNNYAELRYEPTTNTVTLDASNMLRRSNDGGTYNGVYSATVPEQLSQGDVLRLHMYLDASIVDIFVNDKWAFSVRLFPTDGDAVQTEVFAEGPTDASVNAWSLNADNVVPVGIVSIRNNQSAGNGPVYDLSGRRVTKSPKQGIYIEKGAKYYVR